MFSEVEYWVIGIFMVFFFLIIMNRFQFGHMKGWVVTNLIGNYKVHTSGWGLRMTLLGPTTLEQTYLPKFRAS